MNKRQAKKQYKKAHGYNPPSEKQLQAARNKVLAQYGLTEETLKINLTTEQIEEAGKAAKRAFAAMARALAGAGQAITETFSKVADNLESEEK